MCRKALGNSTPGWHKAKRGVYFRLKYGGNGGSPDSIISVSNRNPFRGDARFDLKGLDLNSISGEPEDSG